MSVLSWAPTLEQVADCIPHRTGNVNLPGSTDYLNTFTTDTRPTDAQVQRIVDAACQTINDAVTSVRVEVENLACAAAKWRAAADIELAYHDRDADITSAYASLDARAKQELAAFLDANERFSSTPVSHPAPYWDFPDPVAYGDRNDI